MSFWNSFEAYESRRKLSESVKALTQCDKVSMVFLLSQNSHNGKRVIEYLLNTSDPMAQNKFFYSWMLEQPMFNGEDWAEKFSEPLTILQCFKVTSLLGYKEEELYDKFEPKNNVKSIYISRLKKLLFNLCEIFTREEVKKLITMIENDFNVTVPPWTIDESHKHLEYRLLTWSDMGIINIDEDKTINLKPLYKYLMHFHQKKIISDIEHITTNQPLLNFEEENCSPDYYPIIDKNNLGFCVIINEKNFIANALDTRFGTEKDVERLTEVFSAFGFEVKEHQDVSYSQLLALMDFYRKNIQKNHSFFVLIILSHGSENVIYTSDLTEVPMNSIEMKFQGDACPNLIGKPKIFIVQSCQGEQWQIAKFTKLSNMQTDAPNMVAYEAIPEPEPEPYFVGPQKGDSIIAWSTVQGFASFRDPYNGSWYIEELCKQLWRCGENMDLESILTLVSKNLRSKTHDGQVMVPSWLLSVRAKVKFPFLRKSQCSGRRAMLSRLAFEKYFKEFLNENFKTVINQQGKI